MRVHRIDRVFDAIEGSTEAETRDLRWWFLYRYDWRSARPQGRQQRKVLSRVRGLLLEHPSDSIREWAAHFLTSWPMWRGSVDVRRVLLEAARSERVGRVRGQAIEGLASRSAYGRASPVQDRVKALLGTGLSDPDPHVRFWSLYGVGTLELEDLADQVGAMHHDRWLIPSMWTVGEEAQDVSVVLKGQPWPGRLANPDAIGLSEPSEASS